MSGKSAIIMFAASAAMVVLGVVAAAASDHEQMNDRDRVRPCSLDGVNPVYHPEIFGNPAIARAYYGFVRSHDGTWYVGPNCHRRSIW
jgi:hypothetical protein